MAGKLKENTVRIQNLLDGISALPQDRSEEAFELGKEEGYTKGHAEGVEQGYADGYGKGEVDGYAKGYEDASPELWNNDCAVMSDYWIKDSGGPYPYRNIGLRPGRYRFSVEENLAVKGKQPSDVTGVYCLYISAKKAEPSGYLFSNSSTNQHMMECDFDVAEGEAWYFNIYPQGGQEILFNRLLLGASLRQIGGTDISTYAAQIRAIEDYPEITGGES